MKKSQNIWRDISEEIRRNKTVALHKMMIRYDNL